MTNLQQGFQSYIQAHRWLKQTQRLKWLLFPLTIAILLFPAYLYSVYTATQELLWQIVQFFDQPLYGWIYWLSFPIVLFIVLFLGYIIIKNLIMIVCVPMNAYLADAIIHEELGDAAQEIPLVRSIMRALFMTILAIVIGLISMLILITIGFVPVVGAIISLVLGILIQGFLATWGFFDPVFEREQCSIGKSFWRCLRLLPYVESHGTPFVLLFQIPILGWALAPTYGTISGAWYAAQLLKQGKLLPQDI